MGSRERLALGTTLILFKTWERGRLYSFKYYEKNRLGKNNIYHLQLKIQLLGGTKDWRLCWKTKKTHTWRRKNFFSLVNNFSSYIMLMVSKLSLQLYWSLQFVIFLVQLNVSDIWARFPLGHSVIKSRLVNCTRDCWPSGTFSNFWLCHLSKPLSDCSVWGRWPTLGNIIDVDSGSTTTAAEKLFKHKKVNILNGWVNVQTW